MKIINTDHELEVANLSPELRTLLSKRRAMLDEYELPLEAMAKFIVVEDRDTLTALQTQLDMDALEWVQDHGFAYEAPVICSDDGFALVLFAEKQGLDPVLNQLLRNGIDEYGAPHDQNGDSR
ncbi:MAG: hypothetical protein ACI9KA_001072 [Parasphingorhabdus sp.]|jgi:hypothetical protein|uniref:hypothetical protein n=1 Tax=Parasphingorhabdus sp. TaxID=2709688 RepID=UPI0039E43CCE